MGKLNKKTKPVDRKMAMLMNLYYRIKQDELAYLIILVIVVDLQGSCRTNLVFSIHCG
jgi:hypothetical protein